jgi:predicted nucleic acid-binding protein
MTVVIDASVAVRWSFRMDGSDRADELMHSGETLIAPDFIIAEITNAAWKLVSFDSRPAAPAMASVAAAEKAFDELVPAVGLKDRALEIALALKHPAYDCFYIALAEQRGCRMVTADERLLRRCAATPFAAFVTAL